MSDTTDRPGMTDTFVDGLIDAACAVNSAVEDIGAAELPVGLRAAIEALRNAVFVTCPGCSEAGGAGLPIRHTPPLCEPTARTTRPAPVDVADVDILFMAKWAERLVAWADANSRETQSTYEFLNALLADLPARPAPSATPAPMTSVLTTLRRLDVDDRAAWSAERERLVAERDVARRAYLTVVDALAAEANGPAHAAQIAYDLRGALATRTAELDVARAKLQAAEQELSKLRGAVLDLGVRVTRANERAGEMHRRAQAAEQERDEARGAAIGEGARTAAACIERDAARAEAERLKAALSRACDVAESDLRVLQREELVRPGGKYESAVLADVAEWRALAAPSVPGKTEGGE